MRSTVADEKIIGGIPQVTIESCGNYSVNKVFDCGQAFRFDPVGSNVDHFSGIAFGNKISLEQVENGVIRIHGANSDEYEKLWKHYLALDADYDEIDEKIISSTPAGRDRDEMARAVECGKGIRILRQDGFECLISFIVSQNNNIPRIKKIIAAMCEKYGENNAFPTADALVSAGEDGLFALRTGFRAGYIYDAATKVQSGEIELDKIAACDDYDECTDMLCRIKGVGPKVSSCVLLFGFGKTEAFPIDVWMRRSLEAHFSPSFDPKCLGKYAGIAQQYLFYYERYLSPKK